MEDADLQDDPGLEPDDLPANWEAVRRRSFAINWLQLVTTWAAFALFLVALIEV